MSIASLITVILSVAFKLMLSVGCRSMHNVLGGVIDPHAAYLLLRGMKTLDLRVERHNRSAMLLAARLQEHPKVPIFPQHAPLDV